MSQVKYSGLTGETPAKLQDERTGEVDGIPGVAVKCVDIGRNAEGEGNPLDCS